MDGMKKIAVVTGASSGMGADFARQIPFCVDVDEIWLLARRVTKLESVCEDVNHSCAQAGIKTVARFFEIDLSGRPGAAAFRELLLKNGFAENQMELKVLVNNAGFGTYGTFEDTPVEKELDMIDLNCTSLTGICGFALEFMGEGSLLINTASLASFLPLGNFAVYGASKAFVLSLTMALAAEWKEKGIKVCALCPGPVSTEFANVASNGARPQVRHGLSSEAVVKHCLKCSLKGKKIAIYAPKWKFKAFASRFVGRFAGAWFTYKYCKRPCNH